MSARDITPEQIAAVDLYIAGPAAGNPHKARTRQVVTCARMVVAVDRLIAEAAECRIAAPGLLELREWLVYNISDNCAAAAPPLNVQPDPVKDACAASVVAARFGTAEAYAEARRAESEARAAVPA